MKFLASKYVIVIYSIFLPQYSLASDIVPYSIKRIQPVGSGYLELVGPGKIKISGDIKDYDETKFIKKSSIGTITSVNGSDKGCVLAFASEGYTESISVRNQTCKEILAIFRAIKN